MNGLRSTTQPAATKVRIRGLQGDTDYAALARILEACRIADGLDFVRSADQFREIIASISGFDPADGVRIAEVDDEIVGFAYGLLDGDHPEIGRMLFHRGGVLPDWRGRGIGRALLAEAQAAARRHAASHGGPASATAVYRAFVGESEHDTRRLLEHDGYVIVRYGFSMVRPTLADPPPPDLPPGIEVRSATPATALQIARAHAEAMADHWAWPTLSDDVLRGIIAHPLYGQLDIWQVAWDGDEVVGGVLGFINAAENAALGRARGYTEAIFTRRPWRGRGIATALIGRNLRLLAERGMTEAALGVDAQNLTGALALYERVGFVRDRTEFFYQRPA